MFWRTFTLSLLISITLSFCNASAFGNLDDQIRSSLKKTFGDSISISQMTIRFAPDQKKKIASLIHPQAVKDSLVLHVCRNNLGIVGFGFVDDVKGKTQFITYLVELDTAGIVRDVDILAYREAYGGEIRYESFRKQFRDKTVHDSLKPGSDIKNISGATISVRAITNGVKAMLAVFEILKPLLLPR